MIEIRFRLIGWGTSDRKRRCSRRSPTRPAAERQARRANRTLPEDRPSLVVHRQRPYRDLQNQRAMLFGSMALWPGGDAGNRTRVRNAPAASDYERSCRLTFTPDIPGNRVIQAPVRSFGDQPALNHLRTSVERAPALSHRYTPHRRGGMYDAADAMLRMLPIRLTQPSGRHSS